MEIAFDGNSCCYVSHAFLIPSVQFSASDNLLLSAVVSLCNIQDMCSGVVLHVAEGVDISCCKKLLICLMVSRIMQCECTDVLHSLCNCTSNQCPVGFRVPWMDADYAT